MNNNYTSPDQTSQKVQAVIAKAGISSRRAAEKAITENKVLVNGKPAHVGQRVSEGDTIKIAGQTITVGSDTAVSAKQTRIFLINKPKEVVSTTQDELGRETVLSLIPNVKERLYPVGRLDLDSQGLMVLTNNGDLAYKLTHPKFEIEKEYHALLDREPTPQAQNFLRTYVSLDGEPCPVDDLDILDTSTEGCWVSVVIHQGKYHHVKRLFLRAGYEVKELVRVRFGPFDISDLNNKQWKELSESERDDVLSELALLR